MLNKNQRTLRARAAGYARASKAADPAASTSRARETFLDRFLDATDPSLPEHIRQGQAEYARKQYFTLLAFKSSVARSRKG
jgi:hypothetical protein